MNLFRYPGIRSDSDLYTYGYDFKPWYGKPIATAAEILRYMHEVVDEHTLEPHIRFGHRVSSAAWSTRDVQWASRGTRRGRGAALLHGQLSRHVSGVLQLSGRLSPTVSGRGALQG